MGKGHVGGDEIWQFPIMLCGKYYGCNNAGMDNGKAYVGGKEIWQFPIMLCGKYYSCNKTGMR